MDQIRKRKIMITQWVKEISQQEENKTMILSDAQIEQLSRLTPTKIADFDAVAGIGEKFKNNYGYELLLLLESFNNQSISLQPSQQVNFVLAELEKNASIFRVETSCFMLKKHPPLFMTVINWDTNH